MRHVKLFLASGNNLKKDRDEILIFLANKNQFLVKHGIFLELVRWEFLSSAFSAPRKQDDFNKELADSDVFACLVYDRVGQYTKEEFDQAYQRYKAGKKPKKFYLYFKNLPKNKRQDAKEVGLLKSFVEKEQQIYLVYKNADQLKMYLNQNLEQDLPEIMKNYFEESIQEVKVPDTKSVPDYIMDNLSVADKLLNQNLTQSAIKIYEESLQTISKQKHPVLYANVKSNLAYCIAENAKDKGQEEIAYQRAILLLESSISVLENQNHPEILANSLFRLSYIYYLYSSIRDGIQNLQKAIELAKKSLSNFPPLENSPLKNLVMHHLASSYEYLCHFTVQPTDAQMSLNYLDQVIQNVDPKTDPVEYGKLLFDKATNYFTISYSTADKKERLKYLGLVMDNYLASLRYITMENSPYLFLVVKTQMATAYHQFGVINKDPSYFEKAIQTFLQVKKLNLYEPSSHSNLANLFNLSSIYKALFNMTKNPNHLSESNIMAEEGMKHCTASTNPEMYIRFQINIGCNHRIYAENYCATEAEKMDRYQKAIEYHQSISFLSVKTEYPQCFVYSKLETAKCRYGQFQLTKNKQYLSDAMSHLREADEIFKTKVLPESPIYHNINELSHTIQKDMD